jgi:hypothetical protein
MGSTSVGARSDSSGVVGVGADQNDTSLGASGAVYIFTRSGTTWAQQEFIKASNPGLADQFGERPIDLSDDGNTLVVGVVSEDSNATGIGGNQLDDTAVDSGAAYIFSRSGATWTQQAYIKSSNSESNDKFGFAVSLNADGNLLAVSAEYDHSAATGVGGDQSDNSVTSIGSTEGAVYIFARDGSVWTQQAYVKSSNYGQPGIDTTEFGRSISLDNSGDLLVVGGRTDDGISTGVGGVQTGDPSTSGTGAVYLY